ncbi:hypothetical protein EsH8_VI_000333 [Colletotrichum jinshuiense]
MAFMKLPAEVLLNIAQYCDTLSSIDAVARVNRRFHDVFNPELYRTAVANGLPEVTVLAAAAGNLETLKLAAAYGADLAGIYACPPPDWVVDDWTRERYRNDSQMAGGMDWLNVDLIVPDGYDPGPMPPHACWATPLHLAAMQGHYNVVQWLLGQPNVNFEKPGRFLCQCMPLVRQHPFSESHPDFPDKEVHCEFLRLDRFPAWTPLHFAICNHHTSVARLLLNAGASYHNVRVPNRLEQFPTFTGSLDNYTPRERRDVRRIFGLDDGNGLMDGDEPEDDEESDRSESEDNSQSEDDDDYPLEYGEDDIEADPEGIDFYMEDFDYEAQDYESGVQDDETELQGYQTETQNYETAIPGHETQIPHNESESDDSEGLDFDDSEGSDFDDSEGSDLNDPDFVSAIHIAAASGERSMMTYLVKSLGVDISTKDGSGGTPLHYAILAPGRSAVDHALSLGADPYLT